MTTVARKEGDHIVQEVKSVGRCFIVKYLDRYTSSEADIIVLESIVRKIHNGDDVEEIKKIMSNFVEDLSVLEKLI